MDGEEGIIATAVWIPRGAAKLNPTKVEVTQEEMEKLVEEAEDNLGSAELAQLMDINEEDGDGNDDNEDDDDDYDDADADADAVEEEGDVQRSSRNAEPAPHDDDDEEGDDGMTETERRAVEEEFGLEGYDEEADAADVAQASLGQFAGLTFHKSNDEDPYITLRDDDDEIDDYRLKPMDSLIAAARVDGSLSRIEVHVFNEEEGSFYVHTDFMLESFPLCLEWVGFDPGNDEEDNRGNILAVGSMDPIIELWDLDVLESNVPVATLGEKIKKKGKKPKYKGHKKEVLGLAWNSHQRTALASGSADKTVKLWDLTTTQCLHTYTHHDNKVENVLWNSAESSVLLTGAHGGEIAVFDVRAPQAVAKWNLDGDIECLMWSPWNQSAFFAGTSSGCVYQCDAQRPEDIVLTVQAHDMPVTSMTASPMIEGLIVTGSVDQTVKIWDFYNEQPSMVAAKNYEFGAVFTVGFSPDTPFHMVGGGQSGGLKLINVAENGAVRRRFAERDHEATQHAFALAQRTEQEKKAQEDMLKRRQAEAGSTSKGPGTGGADNDDDGDDDEDEWEDIMDELQIKPMQQQALEMQLAKKKEGSSTRKPATNTSASANKGKNNGNKSKNKKKKKKSKY